MSKPLCIWHGGCDDGFASAWVVRKALGDDVEFYAGSYGLPPPDVTGRNVIMVDFSYKRPVLEDMARFASSILVLDHHKTAQADLGGFWTAPSWDGWKAGCMDGSLSVASRVAVRFDMTLCGAMVAWRYFNADAEAPLFLDYINDRDLWLKRLPGGDEFTIALRSYPQDFAVWDEFAKDDAGPPRLISEGKSIQRYYRLRVEELKRHAYKATLAGHTIWIANAPYFAASEVAGELCDMEGAEFGACFFEVAKGRFQYSLRSRGEFDVSQVATQFGGGGHKNAAGFNVNGVRHT